MHNFTKISKTTTQLFLAFVIFAFVFVSFLLLPGKILDAEQQLILSQKELLVNKSIAYKKQLILYSYDKKKVEEFVNAFFNKGQEYEVINYLETNLFQPGSRNQITNASTQNNMLELSIESIGSLNALLKQVYKISTMDKKFFVKKFHIAFDPNMGTWKSNMIIVTFLLDSSATSTSTEATTQQSNQ